MIQSSKERLIAIAEDTMNIVLNGSYINHKNNLVDIKDMLQYSISNSKLYRPEEGEDIKNNIESLLSNRDFNTNIAVSNMTSLKATKKLNDEGCDKIVCLNFASAKNPGGGFLTGASTQEESLARASGLYPCIAQMEEMYDYNKAIKSGFYSNYIIYSPNVPIFKNDEGFRYESPYKVSFITSPAVNSGLVRKKREGDENTIEIIMKDRIERILSIAVLNGEENIVLGAFGCGVFENDPNKVARYFKELLLGEGKFKKAFKEVIFAVYDKSPQGNTINAFRNQFEITN